MKLNAVFPILPLATAAASKTKLRGSIPSNHNNNNSNNNHHSEKRSRSLEEVIVPYNEIESHLEPWEEIAREMFNNTNDERSQTLPGTENSFKILRPKSQGEHIHKLVFVMDSKDFLIHRVDAEFTDGSVDTGGISPSSGITRNPGMKVVDLEGGPLTGTISVEARFGDFAMVNHVSFDDKGVQVARGEDDRAGQTSVYDVDGRYITGLILSGSNRMRNLQFIVSKEIASSQLVDIDYELPSLGNQQAKSLDTITLSNDSSETQTFSVSYTSIESSAISLSSERTLALSVGFGISTTFDVNIPFIGGSETTAEFTTSSESSFTSGKTEETALSNEISRDVEVVVPPENQMELTVTQFQERVANIAYTATHIITFIDGSQSIKPVQGTMEGVAVSNVFMTTRETPI